MALQDDIQLIASLPLFSDLAPDQLRLIAFGAENRHVAAGATLFREKSPAECAYVVTAGRVQLSALGRQGKPVDAGIAGPGTLLSELALITLVERKFTAVALEDCEVIRITRALFHRLIEEYPDVATRIEDRIRDNIATLSNELERLKPYFG